MLYIYYGESKIRHSMHPHATKLNVRMRSIAVTTNASSLFVHMYNIQAIRERTENRTVVGQSGWMQSA